MNNMQRRAAAAIAVVAVLTTGGVTLAQSSGLPPSSDPPIPIADNVDQASMPVALAAGCRKTFSSGADLSRFVWCFSNDGNVRQIEHPAGVEHVANGFVTEGYCISSNSVNHGYSLGDLPNVGLNPATYPSPTKVVHTTTDGVWKIEQTFAQTTGTKSITITMKITNTSGVLQRNIRLTRAVDADVGGQFGNDFEAGKRSVVASLPNSARLELLPTSLNFVAAHLIFQAAIPDFDALCNRFGASGVYTLANSDVSMGTVYIVDDVAPGGSRTAKFVYRVTI